MNTPANRIVEFEKLGLGLFVHFGLYSTFGAGEWFQNFNQMPSEEYKKSLLNFDVKTDFSEQLALAAKEMGAKYVTFTTRHHDGFSLYDTCGLNAFDAPHSLCKRDLVAEFVDACRRHDLVPFFYHTSIDWSREDFVNDFPAYQRYLRESIRILCTNYGKIGGFWFDGNWHNAQLDWEENALYGLIRSLQPEAMIVNNTGISAAGQLGHPELDSVTFERVKPQNINLLPDQKYVAAEMCQTLSSHWGYAKNDINYHSMKAVIEGLVQCREVRANYLLNVGLRGDGTLRTIDRGIIELLGTWMRKYSRAIYATEPLNLDCGEGCFMVKNNREEIFLFVKNLGMYGDPNVVLNPKAGREITIKNFPKICKNIYWLDNQETVSFEQDNAELKINCNNFFYGTDLIVRVAQIEQSSLR